MTDVAFRNRGCSSVGRAPALQAGGHRFDPVHLHHLAPPPPANRTGGARRSEKLLRYRPGTRAGCRLKGEERVCHVTEADTPGANALDVSEEVSSCEAVV